MGRVNGWAAKLDAWLDGCWNVKVGGTGWMTDLSIGCLMGWIYWMGILGWLIQSTDESKGWCMSLKCEFSRGRDRSYKTAAHCLGMNGKQTLTAEYLCAFFWSCDVCEGWALDRWVDVQSEYTHRTERQIKALASWIDVWVNGYKRTGYMNEWMKWIIPIWWTNNFRKYEAVHGLRKDGKPNLRSRNRPWGPMLDAGEEKRRIQQMHG